MADMAKIRRETMRWQLIVSIDTSRPLPLHENTILAIVRSEYSDATQQEVRRELDYLHGRNLVCIDKRPDNVWLCSLTRYGVDVAEYTLSVEPGIARPEKYFHA